MKGVRVNILFTLYVDCNCCLEVIILPTVFPLVIHLAKSFPIHLTQRIRKAAPPANLSLQSNPERFNSLIHNLLSASSQSETSITAIPWGSSIAQITYKNKWINDFGRQ
jgi:hypothetical protein